MNHLANIITILRIIGMGSIFWLTPYTTNFMQLITILLFTVICLTDMFDGWIARRLKIESDFGKILDPLADKILVLVFLPLLEMQVITSFPVFIILAREFAMMGLRVYSVQKGADSIPAQFIGKLKTIVTLPVCGILLARVPVEHVVLPKVFFLLEMARLWVISWPEHVILLLVYIVVAITIWSFIDYSDHFLWGFYIKRWNNDEEKARQSLLCLIPNMLSILNLLFGCLGIYKIFQNDFQSAALFLVLSILFDAFDGSLARRFNAESKFGEVLDSIADFVSFGILPAIAIFFFLQPFYFVIGIVLAVTYGLSAAYRLIRFSGHSDYFEGIPSPFAASIVIFAMISVIFSPMFVFIPTVILMTLLMISRFPYPHRQMAKNHRFLKFVQFPAFIFTILSVAMLVRGKVGGNFFVYDILVFIYCLYILSPVIYWKEIKKEEV